MRLFLFIHIFLKLTFMFICAIFSPRHFKVSGKARIIMDVSKGFPGCLGSKPKKWDLWDACYIVLVFAFFIWGAFFR